MGSHLDSTFTAIDEEDRYSDSDLQLDDWLDDDAEDDEIADNDPDSSDPAKDDDILDLVDSSIRGKKISKFISDVNKSDEEIDLSSKHSEVLP